MAIGQEEIEGLTVRLEATHARFERDMQRATSALDRAAKRMERRSDGLARRMSRGFSRVGVNIGALAGALSAGALIRGFDRAITKLDDIGKTADKIGLTTDSLQELRSAGEQTGVAMNTMDMALQRFARRTAEARQGTGEAKDALAEMGIELSNADGSARSLDDILNDVADGLQNTSSQSDRVRIAMKLFDSEGVALVNTLARGSEGLEKMRERAREMGVVLAEDGVRAAEQLRNEIDLLSSAFSSGFVGAVGTAAEALNEFFNIGRRGDLARINNEIAEIEEKLALPSGVMRGPTDRGGTTEEDRRALRTRLLNLRSERDIVRAQQGLGEDGLPEPRITITPDDPPPPPPPNDPPGGGASADGFGSSIESAQERLAVMEQERRALELQAQAVGQNEEAKSRLRVEEARLRAAFEASRLEAELLTAAQSDGSAVTQEERAAIAATVAEYRMMSEALIEAEERKRAYQKATEDAADAAKEEAQRAEDLGRSIESVANRFTDAIQQADSFTDALKRIGIEIANLVAQGLGGSGPLGGVLGDVIGNIFGAAVGGFSGSLSNSGNAFGASGSLFTSSGAVALPNAKGNAFVNGETITPFASGGIVSKPTLFPMANGAGLMGEAGPEAIMPLSRGADGKLGVRSQGGGGGNTYVIDARGADAGAVVRIERALRELAGPGKVEDRAVNAVVKARRINPNLFGPTRG